MIHVCIIQNFVLFGFFGMFFGQVGLSINIHFMSVGQINRVATCMSVSIA